MLINKKCAEKTDLASDCEFCCVCKTDHKCHVDLSPYTYDISWREKKILHFCNSKILHLA